MIALKVLTGLEVLEQQGLIDILVEIHSSNNESYQPTLEERYGATDLLELKTKLKETVIARCDKGYGFIIAYEEDLPVGYTNYVIKDKTIKGRNYRTLELGSTNVAKLFQNKGIGKSMYALLEGVGLEQHYVTAITRITWSTNLRQCHLYAEFGYRVYIREYSYYGTEGLDRLHFYKIFE